MHEQCCYLTSKINPWKVGFTAGTLTTAVTVDLQRFHQRCSIANLLCDTIVVISRTRERKKSECSDDRKPGA
ncbi:hypothetical protein Hanom_Chr09g00843161 [Helianthus anomalus]